MNARVNPSAPGQAEIVKMPANAEAPNRASQEPQQAPAPEAVVETPKKTGRKRRIAMVGVPLILLIGGAYFYFTGGRYADTDNAYLSQAIVSLSPDIAGRITDVEVKQNQSVRAGQVLFHIDPAPYQIALEQAQAALAGARVNVEQLRVAYTTAQAKLKAAQATLEVRQREQGRSSDLAKKGVATQAALDDALLATQQAQADVDLAKQGVAGAAAALGGNPDIATKDYPAVLTAQAAVQSAQRNLSETTVMAPAAGVISQVDNLNVGQFVSTGSTIASLVETDQAWVEANFKETQLSTMKVGQPADVTIDAYPGVVFHGKVGSIGAATGSQFSLIPAQNATGNWVKVVQRVPVRIDLESSGDKLRLRSGLSANVSVDTGKTLLDRMLNH